jgi:putative transposase
MGWGEFSAGAAYVGMARKPRQDVPGIHHVYARGNNRQAIFYGDRDREDYLALVGHVGVRMQWRCLAYCLMDNHVHLLLELEVANLGNGMQLLHGQYGQRLNERRGRTGHVFQGRYGNALVSTDEQLWHTIAYIARNPVEAGLCDAPGLWPWSSHGARRHGTAPAWLEPGRLLRCFEGVGGNPSDRYAELVG